MIIVNVYFEEGYNPETDGFACDVVGVANGIVDLNHDPEKIIEAIENREDDFEFGLLHEVCLEKKFEHEDVGGFTYFEVVRIQKFRFNEQTMNWEYAES